MLCKVFVMTEEKMKFCVVTVPRMDKYESTVLFKDG